MELTTELRKYLCDDIVKTIKLYITDINYKIIKTFNLYDKWKEHTYSKKGSMHIIYCSICDDTLYVAFTIYCSNKSKKCIGQYSLKNNYFVSIIDINDDNLWRNISGITKINDMFICFDRNHIDSNNIVFRLYSESFILLDEVKKRELLCCRDNMLLCNEKKNKPLEFEITLQNIKTNCVGIYNCTIQNINNKIYAIYETAQTYDNKQYWNRSCFEILVNEKKFQKEKKCETTHCDIPNKIFDKNYKLNICNIDNSKSTLSYVDYI